MPIVHASGISVRHAVARALATANRSPLEATWRIEGARAEVDGRGRVFRAQVSVSIESPVVGPCPPGLVNPDGEHPMMAVVPGLPGVLLDILPVTWDRWVRLRPGAVPADQDPWCPVSGVEHAAAAAFAAAVGKRLPSLDELRAAWGPARMPWGDAPDPGRGPSEPRRYGEIAEVALFPPSAGGFFDLGCALWQWTAEGELVGGAPGLVPGGPGAAPVGFRCAAERGDGLR